MNIFKESYNFLNWSRAKFLIAVVQSSLYFIVTGLILDAREAFYHISCNHRESQRSESDPVQRANSYVAPATR